MLLPHRLEIRPSPYLTLLLLLLHLAALASLLPLDLAVPLRLAMAAVILASLFFSVRRHGLARAPDSIRGLLLREDGTLEGRQNDGALFDATVSRQSTLLPGLVVLLLQAARRRPRVLVLLPDALAADEARLLRAWLRWKSI
ncbi:MAG TPA: hypothetical protein PKC23_04835 [Candidatus Desulfobacillus sp.]|nr:hypothetical protein [Candidatus Desulfobacillus sp.]